MSSTTQHGKSGGDRRIIHRPEARRPWSTWAIDRRRPWSARAIDRRRSWSTRRSTDVVPGPHGSRLTSPLVLAGDRPTSPWSARWSTDDVLVHTGDQPTSPLVHTVVDRPDQAAPRRPGGWSHTCRRHSTTRRPLRPRTKIYTLREQIEE